MNSEWMGPASRQMATEAEHTNAGRIQCENDLSPQFPLRQPARPCEHAEFSKVSEPRCNHGYNADALHVDANVPQKTRPSLNGPRFEDRTPTRLPALVNSTPFMIQPLHEKRIISRRQILFTRVPRQSALSFIFQNCRNPAPTGTSCHFS